MKRVAKLVLIDETNKHLMLYRSDHPSFPNDPDLPGGTLEKDEEPVQALIRELSEETGIVLEVKTLEKLCESSAYDQGQVYYLYMAKCENRPKVSLSWEHSRYEWLASTDFINVTHIADDRYMRMVYDYLSQNGSILAA